ncbi:hypothetical protein ABZ845_05340 [Streptomyces sp. NPDC047022]|uniref:hypothetical protein n=1 Tax=Streptomyces sp. NPDC047022 TaxID=3155737 RepID=UPI0033F65B1E
MSRQRMLRAAVPAVVLLMGLTAGCSGDHSAAGTPSSSTGPSATGSGSGSGAGVADMEKKVDAAESAAAAADSDAAQDDSGR